MSMLSSSSIFTTRCYAYCGFCCRNMSVCVSVCLSIAYRYCVKTAKHIIKLLSPSGNLAILVFPNIRYGNILTGTLLRGVEYRGMKKLRFSTSVSLYLGNDSRQCRSYYGIGNHAKVIELYHFKRPRDH